MGRPGEFDGLKFAGRREYELACNWKVYVDNYLDGGYHVNTVHPALAGRARLHAATRRRLHANSQRADEPDEAPATRTTRRPAPGPGPRPHYWWVFPNFMLNLYAGVMDTNLVLPLGPDRCRVVFDFYFAAGTRRPTSSRRAWRSPTRCRSEDVGICEEVQRGLGSRSYTAGRFSVRREAAGYHFHRLLAARLASGDALASR